ncbi:TspO/MBR family protein [Halalkalicoccus tibetensis]|uniref:TspO/MBR family protein n=1 Tax=Halalkalicoccus tibetensis TaxID=175632 RepID=A0ABD5V017_9EURY
MTEFSVAGVRISRREVLGAIAAAVLINLIGALGVPFTTPDSAWFQALEKPWFYPPGATFGIVWTLLFTLMGIAAYLVYRQGTENRAVKLALGVFAVQMVVNVAWSPTFFAAQELLLALGVIVVLWVLIVATIAAFARVDRRAAALLVPYLAWVSFAAVLNYSIWALN